MRALGQDHPRVQKAGDFNVLTLWRTDVWLWSGTCFGTWLREAAKKVVFAEHIPTTIESKLCLQTCCRRDVVDATVNEL